MTFPGLLPTPSGVAGRPSGGNDAARAAAVAAPVAGLFAGPERAGSVLGAFSSAAVVGIDTPDGPRVVSLLDRRASGVPIGIRVPGDAGWLPALQPGQPVTVGAGRLTAGTLVLRAARTWRTSAPRIQPHPGSLEELAARLVGTPIGLARQRVSELAAALQAGSPDELVRAVGSLVGLGAGLTPGGDDVLAGLLIGLRSVGSTATVDRVLAALHDGRALTGRTTAISAELLRLAGQGHACLEALRLLRGLHHRPDSDRHRALATDAAPTDLSDAIGDLLAVGHTSGADLATGLLLGLRCHTSFIPIVSRSENPSERLI